MMVIKMLIVILMIIMLDKGWWRRYPCITSGPKKPLLKSEKVPQVKSRPIFLVPILAAPKLWIDVIFTQLISFSAWKRLEVARSMWTLTPRRTCDSERTVIDSLNTCCDPVKVPSPAVTSLRIFVIKRSVVECPRGPFSPSP